MTRGTPPFSTPQSSLLEEPFRREDNPRLVSRQEWWIAYGQWMTDGSQGPICTECADPIPNGAFVGALVCAECARYVPEPERGL